MKCDGEGGVVKPVIARVEFGETYPGLRNAKTHREYVREMAVNVLPKELASQTETYDRRIYHYSNSPLGPVPTVDPNATVELYWIVKAWNGLSESKVTKSFNQFAIDGTLSKDRCYRAVCTLNLTTYVLESDVIAGWEHLLGLVKDEATVMHFRVIVALVALVIGDLHRWPEDNDDNSDVPRLDTAAYPFHPQWKVTPIEGTLQVHEVLLAVSRGPDGELFEQAAHYRRCPCKCCIGKVRHCSLHIMHVFYCLLTYVSYRHIRSTLVFVLHRCTESGVFAQETIAEYESCKAAAAWDSANKECAEGAFVYSKLNPKMLTGNPFKLTPHRYTVTWNKDWVYAGGAVPDMSTAPTAHRRVPAEQSGGTAGAVDTEAEAAFYSDHNADIITYDSEVCCPFPWHNQLECGV